MITLASSSPTRAKILKEAGIKFHQINFDFVENANKNLPPEAYALEIVKSKKEQFFKQNPNFKNVLFADSSVVASGKILGKARSVDEAKKMLILQSQNIAKIITAMIFVGENFELINLSSTKYEFLKFDENLLQGYLASNEWQGKAGAMMIEGFNKQFIKKQIGYTSTAMGLNLEILRAFL